MNPRLEAAIERLYAAFARPAPAAVEGCSCCNTEEELRALVETPLRKLTSDQLGSYGFSALNTVGSPEDLRYFWPRLVELAARGAPYPDWEVVFSKPKAAGWRSWSAEEQAATEHFATVLLDDLSETAYEPGRGRQLDLRAGPAPRRSAAPPGSPASRHPGRGGEPVRPPFTERAGSRERQARQRVLERRARGGGGGRGLAAKRRGRCRAGAVPCFE